MAKVDSVHLRSTSNLRLVMNEIYLRFVVPDEEEHRQARLVEEACCREEGRGGEGGGCSPTTGRGT